MFPASQLVQSRGEPEQGDVSSDSGRVVDVFTPERHAQNFPPRNPEKVERKVSV